MTVVAGLLLTLAIVFSPSHGVVTRVLRRRRLARTVALDDLLAALYRASERSDAPTTVSAVRALLPGRELATALSDAPRWGLITRDGDVVRLTESGVEFGRRVVRRHRLWEHYLVDEAGLAPDHVHDTAEQLEHLDTDPHADSPVDPHGRPIPPDA
jgi:Mn-dependent DtxR family transcriptional regulator